MNTRDLGAMDMGGFSRVCIFKIQEELAIAFFMYDGDEHGEWISVRLVYGPQCPSLAGDVLVAYKAEAIFDAE